MPEPALDSSQITSDLNHKERRRVFQFPLRLALVMFTATCLLLGAIKWLRPICPPEVGAVIWLWFVHAAIASITLAPLVYIGRHRVHWRLWELLVLVLPFIVWSALFFSPLAIGRKSLANLGEPFLFALAVPVAGFVRILMGQRVGERECAVVLILLVCLTAAVIFFAVPSLPE